MSVAVFVAIWSIRKGISNKASLAPAIVGLTGVVSFAACDWIDHRLEKSA